MRQASYGFRGRVAPTVSRFRILPVGGLDIRHPQEELQVWTQWSSFSFSLKLFGCSCEVWSLVVVKSLVDSYIFIYSYVCPLNLTLETSENKSKQAHTRVKRSEASNEANHPTDQPTNPPTHPPANSSATAQTNRQTAQQPTPPVPLSPPVTHQPT